MDNQAAIVALKEMEYIEDQHGNRCPYCEGYQVGSTIEALGHDPSCKLKALIDSFENGSISIPTTQAPNAYDVDLAAKQAILSKLANDKSSNVRASVAIRHDAPADVLTKLGNDKNASVLMALAENPSTPPEILLKLDRKKSGLALMENPNVPAEVIIDLYKYRYGKYSDLCITDYDFSCCANTPKEVIDAIIENDDGNKIAPMRAKARQHSSLEHKLELAKSKEAWARELLARQAATLPLEIIEILARDKSASVRAVLAENLAPNTKSTLNRPVIETPSEPQAVEQPTLQAKAMEPLTPDDIWFKMAKSKKVEDRIAVGEEAPITQRIFEVLFKDTNGCVVEALAERAIRTNHPQLTPDMLHALAAHKNTKVRAFVASGGWCWWETFQLLAKDTSGEVLKALATNEVFIKMCADMAETQTAQYLTEQASKSTPTEQPKDEAASSSNLALFLGVGAAAIGSSLMSAMLGSTAVRVASNETVDVIPDVIETAQTSSQMVVQ